MEENIDSSRFGSLPERLGGSLTDRGCASASQNMEQNRAAFRRIKLEWENRKGADYEKYQQKTQIGNQD